MTEYNPASSAAKNGPPSDTEAVNHVDQLNQHLTTGDITYVFPGDPILTDNPTGNGQHIFETSPPPNYQDRSQPFVMPTGKTEIGRITLPLRYTGNGSDLQFVLCPDDGSGNPDLGNPIVSTIFPRSWGENITTANSLTTDVGPMVTTLYDSVSLQNDFRFNWSQPAVGPGGGAQFSTPTVSGYFMILSGGYTGSAPAGTVVTVQSLGEGNVGNPILQPSLPQPSWYHGMAATSSTVVVVGGTNGVTIYDTVWSANWNPDTGVIGAWTQQTSLPVPFEQGCMASWGDYVYVIGGSATGATSDTYDTIYYANATNGQIQSWSTANSMPRGLQVPMAAAINGWLVVCGGRDASDVTRTETYYAKINETDGSLGSWFRGDDMPTGIQAFTSQWCFSFSESAFIVFSGWDGSAYSQQCQTLPVMTNGIGTWWTQQTSSASDAIGILQIGVFPHGEPGNWQINALTSNLYYFAADTTVLPMISVPLPATSLTPGNTYHLYIHNLDEDLNNYTRFSVAASTNLPTYLLRARYTNDAWTPQANNFVFPITIYDNTPNGDPLHTWQDGNATYNNQSMTSSTFVYDWRGRVLGYCETIGEPHDPLNLNTLTLNDTTNWTAHGGVLTASTAQVHGGYSYSGLLTPDGVTATVYVESELIQIEPGKPYTASAWLYLTTSYAVSMSINWFDSTQTYISTSSNSQTVGAATWTYGINTVIAPEGAAYATLVPTMGGTPSAGNPLYISYATLLRTDPVTLSSVAEVTYEDSNPWGPTGVDQLN